MLFKKALKQTVVLLERQAELVDWRRDLETLLQNSALALQTNVLRPLDKARQIALMLHVLA